MGDDFEIWRFCSKNQQSKHIFTYHVNDTESSVLSLLTALDTWICHKLVIGVYMGAFGSSSLLHRSIA